LNNVLFVGRPSFGQADSTVQMFKVLANGEAIRVPVRIGRVSVNSIEVVEGLQEGDEVILSDMSAYDAYDRVRLN
jgi:HlyD family secretion protein